MTCTHPLLALCLATSGFSAVPALAEDSRGWRTGSGAPYPSDSFRVAHYVSDGLLAGDKVSLVFGSSGTNPIALYNILGDPDGMVDAFLQVDQDFPDLIPSLQEDCFLRPSVGNDEDALAFCVLEDLMADAYAELSVLVDFSDLIQGDDPVHRVGAAGATDRVTNTFIPFVEVQQGATCSNDLAATICAVCFADFQSLAFGEGGESCGASIETPGLAAVQMTMPWFDFISLPIGSATDFGQLKLTVRLVRQSGKTFDISYESGDLMAALFGPRG